MNDYFKSLEDTTCIDTVELKQNISWDQYFMGMAKYISIKSKDPSTKVGALIVTPDNIVVSTGYNGFPINVMDDPAMEIDRYEKDKKYLFTEHAERNAIYFAARHGRSTLGCTLYITHIPCIDCVRGIIQAGIRRIVSAANFCSNPKWEDQFSIVKTMLDEADIEFFTIKQ